MSRGAGRTQRRVLAILQQTPGRELSRRALEEAFCEGGEFTSESNLLRAIRGLEKAGHVRLRDLADKHRAVVALAPVTEPIPEEMVFQVLAERGGRRS